MEFFTCIPQRCVAESPILAGWRLRQSALVAESLETCFTVFVCVGKELPQVPPCANPQQISWFQSIGSIARDGGKPLFQKGNVGYEVLITLLSVVWGPKPEKLVFTGIQFVHLKATLSSAVAYAGSALSLRTFLHIPRQTPKKTHLQGYQGFEPQSRKCVRLECPVYLSGDVSFATFDLLTHAQWG
ncbi:MAG: hypothetical protein KatS3mg028_1699 [Bacteroidia bacterium]|nr:MAG: hypothetical protein KatS3mg028_1699 [Bacteroidia bacterium]